jgi:EpsI family protein
VSGPSRRDFLVGGALAAGAAGAVALTPRERLVLMPPGRKLEDIVPDQIGNWVTAPSSSIILPKPRKGSLADRLYGDQLARFYEASDQLPITMVMAYGPIQSDQLQLHRPEVCYSAVGFSIENVRTAVLDLGPAVRLPVRDLVARNEGRVETISYWTRIGDELPTSGTEQRMVKLRQQWDGYIADGILVRLSVPAEPAPPVLAAMRLFAQELLKSVQPQALPALIGRPLAAAAARSGL